MDATRHAADRLMGALEELIASEAAAVRTGSGVRVREVQARIAPVVARLAAILSDHEPALRSSPRLSAIALARRGNIDLMREKLGGLRRRINQNSDALMSLMTRTRGGAGTAARGAPARRLNAAS